MHASRLAFAALSFATTLSAQQVDTAALRRDLPGIMAIADVPGLSIAVVQNGKVFWTGAFGTVNDSARSPVDSNTVFEAASLSKPVFAYIVMRLVDRGELDLDRPLADILEYPRIAHDERYKRITARMALSHGTGLPNWGGERLDLRFDPGTGYQYSGEGFVYLQKTVEKVTGLSLQQLAQREVFDPLGMAHSSYVWQERFANNAAYAKSWIWEVNPINRVSQPNSAYSLLTTGGDYAKFLTAILNGTGLSQKTVQMMLTPVRSTYQPWNPDPSANHVNWGLGWGLQDGRAGRSFMHGGYNGRRFRAYAVAYPERKIGIVYFANSDDGNLLAPVVTRRLVEDDDWEVRMESPDNYDDPRRLAIKAVQRAAVESTPEAVVERLRAAQASPATHLRFSDAVALADFLIARKLQTVARDLLQQLVVDLPDSSRAHAQLARALLLSNDYDGALAEYRRVHMLLPNDELWTRSVKWMEERIAARTTPVTVDLATMESYAGLYGERRVTLRDGRLYYKRAQNPEYRLAPMSASLFSLEGQDTFRVQFERVGSQPATKIVGIDIDGSTNSTDRTR